jgi:hypothetical protein
VAPVAQIALPEAIRGGSIRRVEEILKSRSASTVGVELAAACGHADALSRLLPTIEGELGNAAFYESECGSAAAQRVLAGRGSLTLSDPAIRRLKSRLGRFPGFICV